MGTREMIEKIVKERETDGGIKSVVWIAAGGSNGGNYPAQYFVLRCSQVMSLFMRHRNLLDGIRSRL